jgi:large repetitive protein
VGWAAPASDGGAPITGYRVTPFVGFFPLPPVTFLSASTSQVVAGLTNGTTYRFKVAAITSAGTGPTSLTSGPATPSA